MYARLFCLLFVLFLVGCGGGGGMRPPSLPPPPSMPQLHLQQDTQAGTSADDAVTYLATHASGGPWPSSPTFSYTHPPGLVRFHSTPTIHLAQGMTDHERAVAHYTVSLLNRALPYDQHLRMGADVPDGTLPQDLSDGHIAIEFSETPPVGGRPGTEADADHDIITVYDDQQQRVEKVGIRAARAWMRRSFFDQRGDDEATVSVLVHELLHTLGLHGHTSVEHFPRSNMTNAWLPITGGLPAIDVAGLQTLYVRLGQKTEPEDFSASSLGPWEQEASVLVGRFGDLSFGVMEQNGIAVPWTEGTRPNTDLTDNQALRGTVVWEGGLVGFTSDNEPIRGETEIRVNLGTLDGRAEFTELQYWTDGTSWDDGDLGYDIAVSGNFLRGVGGDAGDVNGVFYGSAHEGVAGSLERADLTGAFGGRR